MLQREMQAELDKVVAALGEFYARETWLFDHDLGERTLTHRLAVHLEKHYEGWDLDCNYDRLGERNGAERAASEAVQKVGHAIST